MQPEWLNQELIKTGIVVLAVARDEAANNLLVVTLHGNAGTWKDGSAVNACNRVPGVVAVTESRITRTILLVRTDPNFDP